MAPVIDFSAFMTYVFDWRQGQHIGLVGPTEAGKSTMLYSLLPRRKYVVFFATKPHDDTLEHFAAKGGFVRIEDWPPLKTRGMLRRRPYTPAEMSKRLLWPDASTAGSLVRQRQVFARAFDEIYSQGGWTVVWDEFWMMTQILDMEEESRILLQQARSNKISFVMGAQRPARIPVEMFDQSHHLFFARDNDERNLKHIGGVGWLASGPIKAFVAGLDQHQFLYVNTRTGIMYRTTAPELK
jgi:hypothetical protein